MREKARSIILNILIKQTMSWFQCICIRRGIAQINLESSNILRIEKLRLQISSNLQITRNGTNKCTRVQ